MGEYFLIANPAKRQYFRPSSFGGPDKLHCELNIGGPPIGFLIADCSKAEAELIGPFTGSWAGDPMILTGDYAARHHNALIAELPSDEERNLYFFADDEYEPITFQLMAHLAQHPLWANQFAARTEYDSTLLIWLSKIIDRFGNRHIEEALISYKGADWRSELARHLRDHIPLDEEKAIAKTTFDLKLPVLGLGANESWPNGDDYLVVNPLTRQYVDPSVCAGGTDLLGRLGGWMAAVVGHLICIGGGVSPGAWVANPVILTTMDAEPNPKGIKTSTLEQPARNLYALAREEYEDITLDRLFELMGNCTWAYEVAKAGWENAYTREQLLVLFELGARQLARRATSDWELLVVLGQVAQSLNAVGLQRQLAYFVGPDWEDHYREGYEAARNGATWRQLLLDEQQARWDPFR